MYRTAVYGCSWGWEVSEGQRRVRMSQRWLGRYNEFLRFSTCLAYLFRLRLFYLSAALTWPLWRPHVPVNRGRYRLHLVWPRKSRKGKSDWLAKSLVLLQTSWFIMQYISHAIDHLPVTHLEIVMLAYAAMNFMIYIFWWNRPLNICQPVQVLWKSKPRETHGHVTEPISEACALTWKEICKGLGKIATFITGGQDGNIDLSGKDWEPRFWANGDNEEGIADMIVLGVGVCFGVIHCISWGFSFPTHVELLMWWVLCIAITTIPIYIFLGFCLGGLLGDMSLEKFGDTAFNFFPLPGGLLYILARAVTLVLAFTSLRDLPHGAYETVHWTTFIPHV